MNLDKIREKYMNKYNNRHIGGYETLKDLTFEEYLMLKIETAESEVSALLEELQKYNPPIFQEVDKIISETIKEIEKVKQNMEETKKDFQEEYRWEKY